MKENKSLIDLYLYLNEQNVRAEFNGFERLFARYLTDVNAEIKWNKIEPLSKEAVNIRINQ
jgi:hypothetical protein